MTDPNHTVTSRAAMTPDLVALWNQAVPGVRPDGAPPRPLLHEEIDNGISGICGGMSRYREIEVLTGVPWFVTGVLHLMECGLMFGLHLANGDPLTERTINAPEGIPRHGSPPFSWKAAALAVIHEKSWDKSAVLRLPDGRPDWQLGTLLWRIERWNGVGYRERGIPSPYLWAGSSVEQPGRYVTDHVFDQHVWSKQIGAATILKVMAQRNIIMIDDYKTP